MADILLTVGVDTSLSYTEFQSGITSLVSQINNNPPKIKIKFDDASLSTMRKQINDINNSLRNTGAMPVASGGTSRISQQYKDATTAIKNYYAVLTRLNKTKSDVTLTDKGWTSASGNYNELASALNRTKTAFDLVINSMNQMPVQQQVQLQALLTSETNKYNLAVEQQANKERLAAEAAEQKARSQTASANAAKTSANANQVLTNSMTEYHNAVKKVNTLLQQIQTNSQKWTAAQTGTSQKSYQSYIGLMDDLQALQSKLANGTLTKGAFSKEFAAISEKAVLYSGEIKKAGEATQTLSQRVGGLVTKFTTWFGITTIITQATRAVKQMVTSVIELDTAMTELKKVTDETDATYSRFLDNAAERAAKNGAKITDTVTATADFARLGYSIDEAEQLADAAIIYKNVGDGIEDINTASESIIATMQAFGVNAGDIMSIVDKFNEVGNNYAISSTGIGDALLRSAAAMDAAGNTLDQTIGLITAANTIVQNPETVGTTLKTVSMYLRAAKTEAEDAGEATDGMASSVSELRDDLLKLTGNKVDIQIDEDTFKSTYQILQELSQVWNELTDVSQANILEMVGGKRNANVVAALLENFEIAEKAMNTASDSAGSAIKENEKYLESIEGHITQMKSSFEELSSNLIDSEFVKFIVDSARVLMEVLNGIAETLGSFGTIIGATAITGITKRVA